MQTIMWDGLNRLKGVINLLKKSYIKGILVKIYNQDSHKGLVLME